jgi:hypothetical protein
MEETSIGNGDRVRIDIPDETDPDHKLYHGKHGEVISVISDDTEDSDIYRIDLDTGGTFDARIWDLRPPID